MVLLAVLVLAAVFAFAGSAQGATFVLLSGKHAGERVKTDGGPNAPARLNGRRISGRLIPQSGGNEFTFKGTVRSRVRARAQAADNTSAAALPEAVLPAVMRDLENAIGDESRAAATFDSVHISLSRSSLALAKAVLRDLRAKGQIADPPYGALIAGIDAATKFDNTAFKKLAAAKKAPAGSKEQTALRNEAVVALNGGIAEKQKALTTLAELAKIVALIPGEPPPTPVGFEPLFAPGPLTAINGNSTLFAGTPNPGTPDSKAFVVDIGGRVIFLSPPPNTAFAFGPNNALGGESQGDPALWPNPFDDPFSALLPEGDATGGAVRGGSDAWFVGFVSLNRAPFEQAAAWQRITSPRSRAHASKLSFKGFRVGKFAGGSSLFTVSGNLAFGDHFDRGTSGRFRAFRLDLRKRTLTELFRPKGGSSQPLASNRVGVGAGGSRLSNGSLQGTFWWGSQHYVRSVPGLDTFVTGMNDASVAVGVIGPPTNPRAALFEHGKAYDLNTLIPSGSGWTLTKANAISNTGVIVGAGILNGQPGGFLLNLSSKRP
jgi:hypothetical protein